MTANWKTFKAGVGPDIDYFVCEGSDPGPVAVVTAGIHGAEYEGPLAIQRLAGRLDATRLRGKVIGIPVANPSAFLAGTRTNPEDCCNLARCFPGNSKGSSTEQLAAALFQEFITDAGYVIDLHSGGVAYRFLPVAAFYGGADPGNASYAAALAFGLPTMWPLPETAGVLPCEAWKRGKAAIGAEYLGAGQLSKAGVSNYFEGLIRTLAHWKMLDAPLPLLDRPRVCTGDWQLISEDGLFDAACELGGSVVEGATLGVVRNLRGEIIQRFLAPGAGITLGLRSKAFAHAGDWGVLLGTEQDV